MTRKKRNHVPALSLFPFLAVLLCTMGILVVFLFVSVRIAGDNAKLANSEVVLQNREQIRETQADTQLAEIRIEGWQEQLQQRNAEMQNQRVKHSQLLNQIDEFREQTERLVRSYRELSERNQSSQSDIASELESVKEQYRLVSAQVEKVEKELEVRPSPDRPSMYSLIPWNGAGGTARRPIYVECTRDAVILQPAGIRLGPDDFAEPDMPGNPLDAALGEVREYWLRNNVAGENGKPYPLLVVRPDGSASYAIARRAMKNWNDEFGYELIAQDLELDFGDRDPELEKELADTLQRSRELMAAWHQRMEKQRLAEQRLQQTSRHQVATDGLRASRSGGGFVSQGGSASGNATRGLASRSGSPPPSAGTEPVPWPAEKAEENGLASSIGPESRYVMTPSGSDGAAADSQMADGKPGGTGGTSEKANSGSTSEVAATEGGSASKNPDSAGSSTSAAASACVADNRGEGWAVSRTQTQRTAYVRPIVVWCDSEKIRVDAGGSSWLDIPDVRFEKNEIATAENLAIAVRQVTESWGTPPEFGYWRPELRLRVMSGGEGRARQLDRMMDRSGILIAEGQDR